MEKWMGNFHWPLYLNYHIKMVYSEFGFSKICPLKKLEKVFWKVVYLKVLKIIALGSFCFV